MVHSSLLLLLLDSEDMSSMSSDLPLVVAPAAPAAAALVWSYFHAIVEVGGAAVPCCRGAAPTVMPSDEVKGQVRERYSTEEDAIGDPQYYILLIYVMFYIYNYNISLYIYIRH